MVMDQQIPLKVWTVCLVLLLNSYRIIESMKFDVLASKGHSANISSTRSMFITYQNLGIMLCIFLFCHSCLSIFLFNFITYQNLGIMLCIFFVLSFLPINFLVQFYHISKFRHHVVYFFCSVILAYQFSCSILSHIKI